MCVRTMPHGVMRHPTFRAMCNNSIGSPIIVPSISIADDTSSREKPSYVHMVSIMGGRSAAVSALDWTDSMTAVFGTGGLF